MYFIFAITKIKLPKSVQKWVFDHLRRPRAANWGMGIFVGENLLQLLPMKIPLSRLTAPGSPRMVFNSTLSNVKKQDVAKFYTHGKPLKTIFPYSI